MATKQEKEEMRKALSKIDNKWEAMAFIWAYRQKEIKSWIIMILSAILLFMILHYTTAPEIISSFIKKGAL